MKRTGPTNEHLKTLINELRKESTTQKAAIWDRIADDLGMATRQRRIVNLSKINICTKANEAVVVPGKVLGSGIVDHSVHVAAWAFSESAKKRIEHAKGKCITIKELLKSNPKGKDLRIIG